MYDANGHWIGGYNYNPYGEARTTDSAATATGNHLQYISGYWDTSAKLYRLGARYYNPTTGRFTQYDPSGQETNPYAYASGNPINNLDPTGTISEETLKAAKQIFELIDKAHTLSELIDDLSSPDATDKLEGLAVDVGSSTLCEAVVGFFAPETAGASLAATVGCAAIGSVLGGSLEDSAS